MRASGNAKLITVSGIEIAGGADANDYVLANTTATTTGNITAGSDGVELTTWLVPPARTQPLIPSGTTSPGSTLDLTLPSGFGGGTGSAPSTVSGASNAPDTSSVNNTSNTSNTSGVNGAGTVNGPSSVADAQAAGLITVSLVQPATAEQSGLVTVSVPESIIASGAGFSFALPAEIRDAAQSAEIRVTRKNGKRLPPWLRYVPKTRTLLASAVPSSALPMEMLVQNGTMSWSVVITEDKSR